MFRLLECRNFGYLLSFTKNVGVVESKVKEKNEKRHEIFCNGFIWMKICRHSFVARVCLLALNLTQHLTNVILYENLSRMCGNIHNFFSQTRDRKWGAKRNVHMNGNTINIQYNLFSNNFYHLSGNVFNLIILVDNIDWDLKRILQDT